MRLVILESPYAGDVEKNVEYAKACMADSLSRGESPYASHLLLTQVLDDTKPDERNLGIVAGLAWGLKAEATVCYCDYGITKGMEFGLRHAHINNRPVEFRTLKEEPSYV